MSILSLLNDIKRPSTVERTKLNKSGWMHKRIHVHVSGYDFTEFTSNKISNMSTTGHCKTSMNWQGWHR